MQKLFLLFVLLSVNCYAQIGTHYNDRNVDLSVISDGMYRDTLISVHSYRTGVELRYYDIDSICRGLITYVTDKQAESLRNTLDSDSTLEKHEHYWKDALTRIVYYMNADSQGGYWFISEALEGIYRTETERWHWKTTASETLNGSELSKDLSTRLITMKNTIRGNILKSMMNTTRNVSAELKSEIKRIHSELGALHLQYSKELTQEEAIYYIEILRNLRELEALLNKMPEL